MLESYLKNKTRFTSSIKNKFVEEYNKLYKQTRIPKSRLFDEVIEDLIKKYKTKINKKISSTS